MEQIPTNSARAETRPFSWPGIILKAAVIIAILLVSVWLTASAVDLTIYSAYHRYVDNFSQATGLNPYLGNVLLLLFLVPFFFGVRSYLFSLKKEKRKIGLAVLLGLGVLYNASLYFVTRDQFFGADTKYYALVPGGVVFSSRPGTEPRYGVQFQAVTPDKIKWLLRIQRGQIQLVPDPARHDWFDSVTRDPLLWYHTDAEGSFRFFDGPGYAPATGDELKPVTTELRREWEKKQHILDPPRLIGGGPAASGSAGQQGEDGKNAIVEKHAGNVLIAAFQAMPDSVEQCKIAILRWTVVGATSVSVEPGIGAVDPSAGYKVVRPMQTTKYTLKAVGQDGALTTGIATLSVSSTGRSACGPGR